MTQATTTTTLLRRQEGCGRLSKGCASQRVRGDTHLGLEGIWLILRHVRVAPGTKQF
jgi:hypothetical protein